MERGDTDILCDWRAKNLSELIAVLQHVQQVGQKSGYSEENIQWRGRIVLRTVDGGLAVEFLKRN